MSKQWPGKTVVGLTGNIATGKSAVMKMAAEKGALTLDADRIVHQILEEDARTQAAITETFGPEVRRSDGAIDRAALADIVFTDEEALRRLEAIVHPVVRQRIYQRIEASGADVVFIEAIKLLEGELVEIVDQVWVTRAPRRVQIERLIVCRGLDAETAAVRVNAQSPQEAKVARADVVIDTASTMTETRSQVELAWSRLSQPAKDDLSSEAQAPATEKKETSAVDRPPVAVPTSPEEAAPSLDMSVDAAVTVRRARPSDIPGVLLLIQRATGGEVKMKRSDLLLSFAERSYLIGQIGTEITTIVGWNTDSTTAVCIDQFYAHPLEALASTGPALLEEIEQSAQELICEVALAFVPQEAPDAIRHLLRSAGYRPMEKDKMPRAWRTTVEERQPAGTAILGKVLRDIRVS